MRKILIALLIITFCVNATAQEKLYLYKSGNNTIGVPISILDSLVFSTDRANLFLYNKIDTQQIALTSLDSMVFGSNSNVVSIKYSNNLVQVVNPLAYEGVNVAVIGSDVTVTSSIDSKDIVYQLSGTTSDGMFKIYSDRAFTLEMNGVSITNNDGPAINIQSNKSVNVTLLDGTTNYVKDGTSYAAAPVTDGETEDQKGAFFSEAKLDFNGNGTLNIQGVGTDAHGLCSDEKVTFNSGIIHILSAPKDGVHGQEGITLNGGTVTVVSTGSSLDSETGPINITNGNLTCTSLSDNTNALNCDSTFTQTGGAIVINLGGAQSKGIKCLMDMFLSGGTINISVGTTGKAALEATSVSGRYNPAYCSAIKCNSNIYASGSNITITHLGAGGKGISTELDFYQSAGNITMNLSGTGGSYVDESGSSNYYSATGITSNGLINISNGTLNITNSGTAGKGLNSDLSVTIGTTTLSPTVTITASGSTVTLAEPKGIKADGAIIIKGGILNIASNNDGIKSETSVTFNDGTTSVTKSTEGVEAPYITVNGGTVNVTSSDDALNGTKGNGGESSDGSLITLAGGRTNLNATGGDAIDSNGSLAMTGGVNIVQGPSSQPEVAIDVNGTYTITGGLMVASGPSSQMMEPVSGDWSTSSIYCLLTTSTSGIGTNLFNIQDNAGNEIITYKPTRSAYNIYVISPNFKSGTTYKIYTGGSHSGTAVNGYYTGGSYTIGTLKKTLTLSTTKFVSTSF